VAQRVAGRECCDATCRDRDSPSRHPWWQRSGSGAGRISQFETIQRLVDKS
jgi:hypothetical protein